MKWLDSREVVNEIAGFLYLWRHCENRRQGRILDIFGPPTLHGSSTMLKLIFLIITRIILFKKHEYILNPDKRPIFSKLSRNFSIIY